MRLRDKFALSPWAGFQALFFLSRPSCSWVDDGPLFPPGSVPASSRSRIAGFSTRVSPPVSPFFSLKKTAPLKGRPCFFSPFGREPHFLLFQDTRPLSPLDALFGLADPAPIFSSSIFPFPPQRHRGTGRVFFPLCGILYDDPTRFKM